MHQQKITLITLGVFDRKMLDQVAEAVQLELKTPVITHQEHIDLHTFFDSARKQYDGNMLLKVIESKYATNNSITIGLVSVDLFIPILTYIYGQAYLNGNAGIASLYRLGNERYGLAANDRLLLQRLVKEIIHEIGHCLGLIHCHNDCVMQSSTYVEDIDQKAASFCIKCKALVSE